MEKRYQVFVSSTFADLKEERQRVIQTLMEMDCIPAGMELFPAADEEQWAFIRRVIDDCDYYLLIIGGRYGSTTPEGVSYTEKEYDYAVLKGIKVLALLHEKPDEIPAGKSELDPALRSRLQAFRQKVSTGRLVRFWTRAEALPGLVALSLQKTIKSYPAVGWVRANAIATEDVLTQINQLRQENERLRAQLDTTTPPRLFPTNIWLNAWEIGTQDEVSSIAQREQQSHPVLARRLQRDLSRSMEHWSLYSKKDGPNALLRLKGQVNLQASGRSDLRMILVQQRFALDGRLLPSPPDAGPIGFAMMPGQESNVNFEVSVPDRAFREGELLYGLHIVYEDKSRTQHDLEVFWWYDFVEDKFWNNLNKVAHFDSVRAHFW